MARSTVDLANLALSFLVRRAIVSLDETSPEAVNLKQNLSIAIESQIELYDWPECRVVAPLVEAVIASKRGWTYAYGEPSDMIKLWAVTDGTTAITSIPSERGMSDDISSDRNYIFTNQAGAYARYGSSRVSVGKFGPGLFELVALKLAIITCMVLTKDLKLQSQLIAQHSRQLSAHKTLVANSEPEVLDQEFIPESIRIRSE